MKKYLLSMLLFSAALPVASQEERIDTVVPKFLSNGYFFREMPALPDGEKTVIAVEGQRGQQHHCHQRRCHDAKVSYPSVHSP